MGYVIASGPGTASDIEVVSRAEVEAQLERIFESGQFRRSKRLQTFLQYICDLSLKGEAERINEYLLAIEVFRRPASFASHEDSTVRRQAHLLREKLEKYYLTEGYADPIRIEVPVGHYTPLFHRQSPRERAHTGRWPRHLPMPYAAGIAVIVAALTFFLGRASVTQEVSASSKDLPAAPVVHPVLGELWGPWLRDPNGAVVAFSNPLTAVIKHYPEPRGGTTSASSMNVTGPAETLIRNAFELPLGGYVYMTPNQSQIKKGEGFAAVLLAQLFAAAGAPLKLTETDLLNWDDLRSKNMILFGNNDTNDWVNPLLEGQSVRLRRHKGNEPRSIVIDGPLAGEQAVYRTEYPNFRNERRLDYALISMLPGLNHDAKLLLVNGLNHFATQAAVEYLTTPSDIESLIAYLREASTLEHGPWFFQLVLEVEVREGVPTRYRAAAPRLAASDEAAPVAISRPAPRKQP